MLHERARQPALATNGSTPASTQTPTATAQVEMLQRPYGDLAVAWDHYVSAHADGSPYHLTRWLELVTEVFGHEVQRWIARSEMGQVIGILPVVRLRSRLFGDYGVALPFVNYGGAIATDWETRAALVRAASEHADRVGMSHVEFRDRAPDPAFAAVRTDKFLLQRPLPPSVEQLWQALGGKLRAQVRRPQRENASVDVGGSEHLDDFYAVFARNMRDLGTPVYGRDFFATILAAEPSARIVVVRIDDQPAAVGLLIRWRQRMEIPWAASLRRYNPVGVNMLLYWTCLEYAIAEDCDCFDFGRSSRDSGTWRFKRQWGAEPVPCYWHYWLRDPERMPGLTPENPRYHRAIRMWQCLPVSVANVLGPRIVRSLP